MILGLSYPQMLGQEVRAIPKATEEQSPMDPYWYKFLVRCLMDLNSLLVGPRLDIIGTFSPIEPNTIFDRSNLINLYLHEVRV